MKTATISLLRKQIQFHHAPQKWAAAKGGVGSGKTMAMVWWAIRSLEEYPKASIVAVGADYEQLRRGFFPSLVGVLEEDLGWEAGRDFVYRDSPSPMIRFLHTGARLRSLSAELAQRIRGAEFQRIICEEPQTWHNGNGGDTFRVLTGRLRHSRKSAALYPNMKLQGRMTFNPPAIGTWLYDLIEKAWKRDGYPCWTFSLRDNVLLPGRDEYIRQLETMYPPDRWPVEIDGEWSTLGGQVYRTFDRVVHCQAPDGLPPIGLSSKPLLWSLDFNVGLMCSVVAQAFVQQPIIEYFGTPQPKTRLPIPEWQRRVFYVIDELALPDSSMQEVVPEFIRRYGEHARKWGVEVYGDRTASGRSQLVSETSAVNTNWRYLRDALRAANIPVRLKVPNNPEEGDRVNEVKAQFQGRDGFGMLIDAEKCPTLINDLFAVRYKDGTNKIEKKNSPIEASRLTHMSDALGYMIYVERQLERNAKLNLDAWNMSR